MRESVVLDPKSHFKNFDRDTEIRGLDASMGELLDATDRYTKHAHHVHLDFFMNLHSILARIDKQSDYARANQEGLVTKLFDLVQDSSFYEDSVWRQLTLISDSAEKWQHLQERIMPKIMKEAGKFAVNLGNPLYMNPDWCEQRSVAISLMIDQVASYEDLLTELQQEKQVLDAQAIALEYEGLAEAIIVDTTDVVFIPLGEKLEAMIASISVDLAATTYLKQMDEAIGHLQKYTEQSNLQEMRQQLSVISGLLQSANAEYLQYVQGDVVDAVLSGDVWMSGEAISSMQHAIEDIQSDLDTLGVKPVVPSAQEVVSDEALEDKADQLSRLITQSKAEIDVLADSLREKTQADDPTFHASLS